TYDMQGTLGAFVIDVVGRCVNFSLLNALSVCLSKLTYVCTGNVPFAYSLFQNKRTMSVQHGKLTFFFFNINAHG
ncbi:hypothetical protein P3383_23670, partial [Vibrio parahaemolyticus]|nr:hypothetical protein [Vibrio parahaemolyticus]